MSKHTVTNSTTVATKEHRTVASHITKYGMTKSLLQHIMLTKPVISKNILHCLSSYHCIYWTGKYLSTHLVESKIRRLADSTEYLVVYYNILPETAFAAAQVFISFRAAQPEFNLPAYAMICAVR